MSATGAFGARQGVAYGLLGLPLAFVALPLYVLLPHHYAQTFGMPLATLGALLLLARLADAVVDPLLGRLSDLLFSRSARAVLWAGLLSALVMAVGLTGLFYPQVSGTSALSIWALVFLLLTYTAYSQLGIAHQSWGARLGGDEAMRGRVVAWREGAGLLGVVLASLLPALAGLPAMLGVFAGTLVLGWLAWTRAPVPHRALAHRSPSDAAPSKTSGGALWQPWAQPAFRRLMLVFVLNGIASAIPATLVLFFIQDRLGATTAQQPAFLATYFVCAALSIALWLQLVNRIGLARTWLVGMVLSVAVFGWTALLGEGDLLAFMVVCALAGATLGTDLALPSALLAGVIAQQGHRGELEGAYFGWWNFATKLNLALAAGLALPALGLWGYVPGERSPQGLQALVWAYAVLPCVLKLLAACALYGLVIRPAVIAKETSP
jgi:Na+/melibiose symporter-like transporter